ncbi:MAG TPA: TlpA disulfide reductase family protein, partial [Verrucomicrobiae bacterium]|nr:TlpA disulfide reductase family protein [Verrucomicrobiae bacterium]
GGNECGPFHSVESPALGKLNHSNHMNKSGFHCNCIATLALLAMSALLAGAQTNSTSDMDPSFVKTNGEYVTIGSITVKTNSPLNTDKFKHFMWREQQLMQIANSRSPGAIDKFVAGSWSLIKDYPDEESGYQNIMMAIEDFDFQADETKARALANELAVTSAPEKYKLWANGFLHRIDSRSKPVSIKFTAVDGREVDLSKMRGKVILVDFWGTHCGPCIAEMPRIKAAWQKFHEQGFEVIGISCDTSKKDLEEYVTKHDIPWPQFFDGKQQEENRFTVEFGIDGIPHMFLVGKEGDLRFDNVRARDEVHAKGDAISFEDKISQLLDEN